MIAGKLKYFAAALAAAIIWGFFSIPLRMISHYPADQILYYRIFTSLLITWLIILLFRREKIRSDLRLIRAMPPASRRRFIILNILAGIFITGNWFTYIHVVNEVNLKSAAFAYMVCPILTAIGGFAFLKEQLSALKILAILIASASILTLAQGSLSDVLWSVGVAALYSFYLIIQRLLGSTDRLNMLGVHLILATLLILPVYSQTTVPAPLTAEFWIPIVIISVFFTIIPLFLSLYALIGLPSSTLGIMIYINPIIAFAVAFLYFHEGFDPHQIYAYATLLVAVIVFNWNVIVELIKPPAPPENG